MFELARGKTDLLFCSVDWHTFTEGRQNELSREIDSYHPDRLLNTSTEDLSTYFVERYSIDVPILQETHIMVEQQEQQIDVSQDTR